jgi:hypothetical protein
MEDEASVEKDDSKRASCAASSLSRKVNFVETIVSRDPEEFGSADPVYVS